jgi:hypothetical protein
MRMLGFRRQTAQRSRQKLRGHARNAGHALVLTPDIFARREAKSLGVRRQPSCNHIGRPRTWARTLFAAIPTVPTVLEFLPTLLFLDQLPPIGARRPFVDIVKLLAP